MSIIKNKYIFYLKISENLYYKYYKNNIYTTKRSTDTYKVVFFIDQSSDKKYYINYKKPSLYRKLLILISYQNEEILLKFIKSNIHYSVIEKVSSIN